MIELAKHIEVLLLENDCVIVPGLGGFIAHNRQAEFKESENTFCSPARTIGFNPQLVMNDGLLVQTYMQAYNTDFPDATRKIEKIVSEIKEQLYKKGEVCLLNIGTLYYTMEGAYVFEPSADSFFTPYLYGLNSFSLPKLQSLTATTDTEAAHPFISAKNNEDFKHASSTVWSTSYKKTFQRLAQHSVGVAAAILLFFLLSVPVENTYMDDASYASLSAESMFDAIRGRSVATQLLGGENDDTKRKAVHRTKSNVNTLKPVCVKSETVAPAPANVKVKKTVAFDDANNRSSNNVESVTTASKAVNSKTKEANVSKANATKVNATKANTSKADAVKTEKTDAVKAEKTDAVKTVSKPQTAVSKTSNGYHIIVASLATSADAQKQLKKFKNLGFTGASILPNGKHFRIALYSFGIQAEAYKKLKELRKQDEFKQAWLFTAK